MKIKHIILIMFSFATLISALYLDLITSRNCDCEKTQSLDTYSIQEISPESVGDSENPIPEEDDDEDEESYLDEIKGVAVEHSKPQ